MTLEEIIISFTENLNDQELPITFVTLDGDLPFGICSLCENDGIRPDLTPLLGALVVDPKYQKEGIGKMLVDVAALKAKELGFEKLYFFAFDSTIPEYYEGLGWKKIVIDEFKSHPCNGDGGRVMKVLRINLAHYFLQNKIYL